MLKVKISGNNSCKFLDIFMRSLIMWWVMIEKPELTKVEAERYSKTNSDYHQENLRPKLVEIGHSIVTL